MAQPGEEPFFDQLMKNKAIKKNVFAFFLSYNPKHEPSEITFGFYDTKRFVKNTMSWHKVVHKVFWAMKLTDVRIGKKSLGLCLNKACTICPDSGTSLMTFPAWAINQLKVEKTKFFSGPWDCQEHDEFKQEDIVFVIGDKEYHVPSHHWVKRTPNANNGKKSRCSPSILPLTIFAHGNKDMFILGNTFMQLFYTVFDRDTNRVGFSTAIHKKNEILNEFNSDHKLAQSIKVTPKLIKKYSSA